MYPLLLPGLVPQAGPYSTVPPSLPPTQSLPGSAEELSSARENLQRRPQFCPPSQVAAQA